MLSRVRKTQIASTISEYIICSSTVSARFWKRSGNRDSFLRSNKRLSFFILFARLSLLPCVHFARIYARKRKIERKREGEREKEGGREKEIRFRYHTFTIFFFLFFLFFFSCSLLCDRTFEFLFSEEWKILLKGKFYALCWNKFWKCCEIFFLFFFFFLNFFLFFFFFSSSFVSGILSHTFKRGLDILRGNCFGLIDVKKGGRGGVVWKGPRENRHTEKDSERDFLSWPFTPLILSHKINSLVYKLTSSIQMYFWLSVFFVFSLFFFYFIFFIVHYSTIFLLFFFFFFSFSLFYKTSRFPSFSYVFLFSSSSFFFHLLVIFFFINFRSGNWSSNDTRGSHWIFSFISVRNFRM